ncbi:hypothetical protein LTR85_011303 [Meristemomyces frigidus]|nr:hypothetical protein LTR85_011303 [Meristemomyces frigidus]
MRIAIIGAGISGLTLYLFLEKLGLTQHLDVTIYEAKSLAADRDNRASDATDQTYMSGLSLGFAHNGLSVLCRLSSELHDEVLRTGRTVTSWRLSSARGWTLATVDTSGDGTQGLMIGRHSFWQCLRSRVPEDIVSYRKVTRVEVKPVGNVIHFTDGESVEADLVVGGDGIWSVVRRAIFDTQAEIAEYEYAPHYEGLVGVGGTVADVALRNVPAGQMNAVFGRNGFFGYGRSGPPSSPSTGNGEKAVWWSTYNLKDCPLDWRDINTDEATRQLEVRHKSWKDETIQAILQDPKIEGLWPTFTTPLLPTWERQGCVLIGDAAHALQPSSGQGASMALEDAEALALLLAHNVAGDQGNGHRLACKQYSDLRMPRLAEVHKKAQETASMKQDMSLFGEFVMYFAVWLINVLHLNQAYNRALYGYDVPKEVDRFLAAKAEVL